MSAIIVFLVSLSASIIGGICGIGGGIIVKPALDMLELMPVSAISFLSGFSVLSMALVSVVRNRRSNKISVHTSLPLGIGAALGGILGKHLFESVKQAAQSDRLLGFLQALLLELVVLGTLLYSRRQQRIVTKHVQNQGLCSGIGLLLGMLSSFLGIGGGPMNLAVLHYFFSMEAKTAASNSLLIILISQMTNLLLTLLTGSIPTVSIGILVLMISAGLLGGTLAVRLKKGLSSKEMQGLFQGLLILLILICLYNMYRFW